MLIDAQRSTHQRLGLGQPVRRLEQLSQVVQTDGHFGMILPEALLIDCQRATHQRLGLGQPVRRLEQGSQVVQIGWPRWDDPPKALLIDLPARDASTARRLHSGLCGDTTAQDY